MSIMAHLEAHYQRGNTFIQSILGVHFILAQDIYFKSIPGESGKYPYVPEERTSNSNTSSDKPNCYYHRYIANKAANKPLIHVLL